VDLAKSTLCTRLSTSIVVPIGTALFTFADPLLMLVPAGVMSQVY